VRAFRFDVTQEQELTFRQTEPTFTGPGLCVDYDQPLTSWYELIRQIQPADVLDQIGSHFLPYFLYRWLPKITIQFDDSPPENITAHFKGVFVQYDTGNFPCELDGSEEVLSYSLTRITKSRLFKSHCLLFSAADRIVGSPRDLATKLGEPHFVDEKGEKYVVIAVVRGEAFEGRLNDARTSIDLPTKVAENIVSTISDVVQSKERGQIEKIKSDQSAELGDALKENPILRLGLRGRTLSDYVAAKPNHWRAEEFISDLAIERYRATNDLTKQIVAAASNREDYEKKVKELVSKLDQGKKEALAEYIIHRKNIISLVESAQRYGEDATRAPEEDIHELVFRRFSDNVEMSYFEHNLWLIDDALAFLPYVSSDRAMHGKGRKAGDKVTDLLFYDDSLVLGDEEGTTLTIVEFKKPSRDDYSFGKTKSDPVLQVIETLEKATAAGGITRTDGSHMSFPKVVRRFAFIVADVTPTLSKLLKQHDFKNDWNPRIYVRYRTTNGFLSKPLVMRRSLRWRRSATKRFSQYFLTNNAWTPCRMPHETTIVLGIEIPSTDPAFLTTVAFHVLAGLVCVAAGVIAMLSEKRPGRHPSFGAIYYWSLAAVFASATALAVVRWAEDYHLFILGALSFGAAFLGRTARQQRWRGWVRLHIICMGASYILLLTAFYVDNGKSLPFWRELPSMAYWLVPGAIGIPLVIRALPRHPLAQHSPGFLS